MPTFMYIEEAAAPPAGGWSLSYVSDQSINSQTSIPAGIKFSSDGTKMYVASGTSDKTIYYYDLSTAWDETSATNVPAKDLDVSSDLTDSLIGDIDFNADGTVLIVAELNGNVHRYTLSTSWNTSTASYDTVLDVSGKETNLRAISFGNSGARLYVTGYTSDAVHEYSVSPSYDTGGTVTFLSTFSLNSEEFPSGLSFYSDGTSFFTVDAGEGNVYKYDMSTAWDISTASYDKEQDVSTKSSGNGGCTIGDSDEIFYTVANTGDKVVQFTISDT